MRAGRLRHRISIKSKEPTQDETSGEVTYSWSDFASNIAAAIEPQKGEERFIAQQRQASTTHRVVIRYRAGITKAMRVQFGSRYFAIKEIINPDERNRELQLMCEEGLQDVG